MLDNIKDALSEVLWKPESEVVEFKKADNTYDTSELCEYVSALANEANIQDKSYALLILWVEPKQHKPVGTNYKTKPEHLQAMKQTIYQLTKHSVNIHETIYNGERLVIFEIPPAPRWVIVTSNWHAFGREWSSLSALSQSKSEYIRKQSTLSDWSAKIIPEANIDDLSLDAIEQARHLFKVKNPRLSSDVDLWSNSEFLDKAKITIKWKITNTAILLLWRPESDVLLSPSTSKITWILQGSDGVRKDYKHFFCPLLLSANEVFGSIRNLKYRYLSGESLFPEEVDQYHPYIIREALNNCIAHQDYTLGWRISVVEKEDGYLTFLNNGSFIPKSIENVVYAKSPESVYRNKFLADAMVSLNMIDTIGSGILKMFQIQKDRFFPLPEYDISDNKVQVTITWKVLDIKYAVKLAQIPNLSLEEIILLDKVQKRKSLTKKELKCLRDKKLIEWKIPNIIISSYVASATWQNEEYAKLRWAWFDNKEYKDMILNYIDENWSASRYDIDKLLFNTLPDVLDNIKKKGKIKNIISSMSGIDKTIKNIGIRSAPKWVRNP